MVLDDYKDIVGTCAAITTIGHMLSGTVICKDIHKKKSSESFDPMPFLGGVGMSILMLRYAWMLGDPTMIKVNVFGLIANTVYMAVYCYYSPNMKDTLALISKAVIFIAVFLAYTQVEHPDKVEYRYGIITTVLLLFLIASPLIHLRKIIETKDTSILPFPLIVMGTAVSFQWLLYGLIINNVFVIFQNSVGFVLSVAQLSLFIIFPSKSSKTPVPTLEKKKD
ncbi:sugar transporter SWEET1 [Vespa velutina]|uniref:sugar transporter SWEET1 n=1 Tax=Vespa velutina TaxID=202808 RepID=UPI001FB3375B|nr:sugar transporter SWEET1 [Vespa velutina]